MDKSELYGNALKGRVERVLINHLPVKRIREEVKAGKIFEVMNGKFPVGTIGGENPSLAVP